MRACVRACVLACASVRACVSSRALSGRAAHSSISTDPLVMRLPFSSRALPLPCTHALICDHEKNSAGR
eukprot:642716-Pleurochrysis_carterae.AAC.1